jgi:maltose O-acetyltransferase
MCCLFIKNYGGKMLKILRKQLALVSIHGVNLVSNGLGNDGMSCLLREGTVIRGGGYIYGGDLVTGERCYINRNCYFDFTAPIRLGHDVVIGHGVTFITAEHAMGKAQRRASSEVTGCPIEVGDGVWIGANVTVLPGVVIAPGAVVAAGTVVIRDVPAHTLVAGVPARVIKSLSTEELTEELTEKGVNYDIYASCV